MFRSSSSSGKKKKSSSTIPTVDSHNHKLSVFVGTWNLGNAVPPSATELTKWIPTGAFDVYAIGAQEAEYKTDKKDAAGHFFSSVRTAIGPGYTILREQVLWEMRLAIYIADPFITAVSNVLVGRERTGVAGMAGNKGGIAVSFEIFGTPICFVSSHLAAHQENVKSRNANVAEILSGISMKTEVAGQGISSTASALKGKLKEAVSSVSGIQSVDLLHRHPYLFWMGDLNYRVDLPRDKALKLIGKKDFATLFKSDQLMAERKAGHVFPGFREGSVTFPPTYRYNRGEQGDTYSEERSRVPSWTDRILWRAWPGYAVTLTMYRAVASINTSDHKPIFATYHVVVPDAQPQKYVQDIHDGEVLIVISNLRGSNLKALDTSGSSDPYIVFNGPMIKAPVKTSIINQNLNPKWHDEDVPHIVSTVKSRQYLDRQHIIVTIWDKDAVTADDKMGHCIIPLHGAGGKNSVQFVSEIELNGAPAGTLKGDVLVKFM